MAAPYNPPKKNEDFIFGITVDDMSSPGSARVDPTVAAGDFKISKDFGAFVNLTTTPTVTPVGGRQIQISLSATEMNADGVMIQGVDQTSPKEWADFSIFIPTTA